MHHTAILGFIYLQTEQPPGSKSIADLTILNPGRFLRLLNSKVIYTLQPLMEFINQQTMGLSGLRKVME